MPGTGRNGRRICEVWLTHQSRVIPRSLVTCACGVGIDVETPVRIARRSGLVRPVGNGGDVANADRTGEEFGYRNIDFGLGAAAVIRYRTGTEARSRIAAGADRG